MRDRLIYFVYFGVILACVILYALEAQAMGGREYYYTNINPLRGDCEDFALTKLVELSKRGVPLRGMRLARGRAWGESHMVLVVNIGGRELVLDNLATDLYENKGRFTPITKPISR
jgi:predicted transglutaminase-like cysteine proteinase